MKEQRLFIVTGKGGVGKTLTSFALAKKLQETTSKKVLLNSLDQPVDQKLAKEMGVEVLDLPLLDSTIEYISRKIKSKTLANWVMRTSFFKALFNMVPALGNMITFGHLIDLLEDDEETIIVVDAPSSGHILTVLESPLNFKQIFKSGALVKDIERMLKFSSSPFIEIWVLSIPTELAVVEGKELYEKIKARGVQNVKWILNNSFLENDELSDEELPEFLKEKLTSETNITTEHRNNFDLIIPMHVDKNFKNLISHIKDKISTILD